MASLVLTPEERRRLSSWSCRVGDTSERVAFRARIILMAATGAPSISIAERLRTSEQTVCKWRGRFVSRRLEGIWTTSR